MTKNIKPKAKPSAEEKSPQRKPKKPKKSGKLIQSKTSQVISDKQKKQQVAELKKVIDKINKKFGENIVRLGSQIVTRELVRVPISAVPSLSFAIGGGTPRGRVITIAGPFSSCKSAIGYRATGDHQRAGFKTALVDVEGTYTPEWGAVHGIDNDLLIYYRPETAEEALDIATDLAKAGIEFIMLDSITALSPEKEMESKLSDGSRLALQPELIGRFLRKMNSINNKFARQDKDGVDLLLVNQLREKPMALGDPEYETGGRAIGFYASIQIRIRRGDWIRVGSGKNQRVVGQIVKFKITKNKTYKMLQTGEFDFYTDDSNALGLPAGSFDTAKQLIVEGVAWGIIEQPSQGYYIVNGQKIRGIDNLIATVRDDEELSAFINDQVQTLVKQQSAMDVEETLETRDIDVYTGEIIEE